MPPRNRWMVAVLVLAGLQPLACQRNSDTHNKIEPARVEHVEGTNLSRVILTPKAAERLGIETAPVREAKVSPNRMADTASGNGVLRKIIPYAAVLYDAYGGTWTYVNPTPLVFVRHRIHVDYIEGDRAVLLDGPPTGTEVATVGVAELYGTEFGVGH